MSGICAKHHGYVQPGERCPYCEPEGLNAALPADVSGLFGLGPMPSPLMRLDACPTCRKSGQQIMAAGETYKTHACLKAT